MDKSISHQFQKFPNPNPNFDQFRQILRDDQLTKDSPYFHIANFLMSDEVPEESILAASKRVVDCFNGPSNSITPNSKIKCKRGLKKYKTQEEFRFAFRTKTDLEFMDDGFKWRKYGKKIVKSSPNPRNYFKCTSGGCRVKKRVERDGDDPRYVITTYEGIHNHETPSSTCHMVYCTSTNTTPPSSLVYTASSFST